MKKGCCPKCDKKLANAKFKNGKLVSGKCRNCGFEYKGGECEQFLPASSQLRARAGLRRCPSGLSMKRNKK